MGGDKEAPDAIMHLVFLVGLVEARYRLAPVGSNEVASRRHSCVMGPAGRSAAEIAHWARHAAGQHGGQGQGPGQANKLIHACASAA
ncbi:hypothetical protein D3C87_1688630 [compost metagenome]